MFYIVCVFYNTATQGIQYPNSTGNKVITTMMIRPLDDCITCVQSAFTHLGFWRMLCDCSRQKFRDIKCLIKRVLSTFSSNSNRLAAIWKGDFSTSLLHQFAGYGGRGGWGYSPKALFHPSPPDDIYCCRSYCFIEWQKLDLIIRSWQCKKDSSPGQQWRWQQRTRHQWSKLEFVRNHHRLFQHKTQPCERRQCYSRQCQHHHQPGCCRRTCRRLQYVSINSYYFGLQIITNNVITKSIAHVFCTKRLMIDVNI